MISRLLLSLVLSLSVLLTGCSKSNNADAAERGGVPSLSDASEVEVANYPGITIKFNEIKAGTAIFTVDNKSKGALYAIKGEVVFCDKAGVPVGGEDYFNTYRSPAIAEIGEKGTFEIKNVPAKTTEAKFTANRYQVIEEAL